LLRFMLVTAYWTATRLAVGAVLLVTCLYFVLNSGPFPRALSGALKSVLPGTIEFSTLQISPIPWKVDVLDVHIRTPDGRDVITAGRVQATMDLIPLARWILGESGDLLEIGFRSARLEDYSCVIAFDETGNLKFLRAFVWPPEPGPEKSGGGPKVRLRFASILGERGTFFLSFPEWDMRVDNISLETALTVRENGGGVEIMAPDLTFSGGVGRIRAAPGAASVPRTVFMQSGRVRGFHFDKDRFTIDRARISFDGFDLDASGSLAFPRNGPLAYDARADLNFHAKSPQVRTATQGIVQGAFMLDVEGKGDDNDPRFTARFSTGGVTVAGLPLGAVAMTVEGGKDVAEAYAFRVRSLNAHPGKGEVNLKSAVFYPFGRKNNGFPEASLDMNGKGVNLALVLESLGVPALPRQVPIPRRLKGRLRASVSFGTPDDPDTTIDVSSHLSGLLPVGSLMDGRDVSLNLKARGRLTDSGVLIRVRDLALRSGRDEIRGIGRLDLGRMRFTASGAVQKEVGSLMRAFGSTGQGIVKLKDITAGGALDRPDLSASLKANDLMIGKWAIGEARAGLNLHRGRITLKDVSLKTPYGMAEVGAAALWPLMGPPAKRRVEVSDLTVTRFNLMRFPPLQGMNLKGSGKIRLEKAGVQLSRPLATLFGGGSVSFGLMGVMGRRFSRVKAEFSAVDGVLEVPEATARLLKGRILASGTLDLRRRVFNLQLKGDNLPLAAVAGTGKSGPLQGTVKVAARASGDLNDPRIEGKVDVDGLSWDRIDLGAISISTMREPGQDLMLSSDRFLPRIELNPESGLTWKDGRFAGIHLMLDFDELTPQDINPAIRKRNFWGRFSGRLNVRLGFGSKGTLWASLTSPPDGLELGFMDREVSVVNRERLNITIHETEDMTVSGLALDDGSGILEVCGVALDPDGKTSLLARGPVGMYWLRFLKNVFSVADGYFLLAAAPGRTFGKVPKGCDATMMEGGGSTWVGGSLWPVFQPSLSGLVTTGPINLSIRGYPDSIHINEGTRILVQPASGGRVRAVIGADGQLRGNLGGGKLAVYGDVLFKGYTPDCAHLRHRHPLFIHRQLLCRGQSGRGHGLQEPRRSRAGRHGNHGWIRGHGRLVSSKFRRPAKGVFRGDGKQGG